MKLKTETTFDAAHRLVGYKGKCSQLHGHLWRVVIEVEGYDENCDEVGILWDFTNVKDLREMFDHKTILKDCIENTGLITIIQKVCGKDSVVILEENATAEYLVEFILSYLKGTSPNLNFKVTVYESPKSYAEGRI